MFLIHHTSKRSANLNRSVAGILRCFASSEESSKASVRPRAANLVGKKRVTDFSSDPEFFRKRQERNILHTPNKNRLTKNFNNRKKKASQDVVIPESNWIQINGTPPLANLEDIVESVNQVLDVEREIGIIDLDPSRPSEDGCFPRLELSCEPWIKSAKVVLSTHGRPTCWRIEFENRSIVNAFLQHARENRFLCIWKKSLVEEWRNSNSTDESSSSNGIPFEIDDNVIRVENCDKQVTRNNLRHAFRRFDFSHQTPNIWDWENEHTKGKKIFLLRFADSAWARAAIREMQGFYIHEKDIQLAQYPKQKINQIPK